MDALKSKHVLVVDGDRGTLGLLDIWLAEAGYDVVTCARFEDAKRYLAGHTPDILLTDLRLGAFNGLQFALLLKEAHPNVIVVVFSAYDDPFLETEATRYGARFIQKPTNREALLQSLADMSPPATFQF